MTEEWRAVVGYEGLYEVSNLGRVRSLGRMTGRGRGYWREARMMTLSTDTDGYRVVNLSKGGTKHMRKVHRLVAQAFIPGEGLMVLHGDGDPTNNTVENLRWGEHRENGLDTVRHGRHRLANQTHCKNGHELTEENTYVGTLRSGTKARVCRTCHRENEAARRAAHPDGFQATPSLTSTA